MDADAQLQQLRRRLQGERSLFLSLLVLLAVLFYFTALAHRVYAILVDGVEWVYVGDEPTARAVVDQVLRQKAAAIRSPQTDGEATEAIFVQEVTWRPVLRRGQGLATAPEAQELLARAVDVKVLAAVILGDGKPLVALPKRLDASEALEILKARYAERVKVLVEEPRFKEKVTIEERYVRQEQWVPSVEEAVRILSQGPVEARSYRVRAGDVAGRIAREHGLTLRQLQDLNPGRDLDHLRIGETLRLTSSQPLLTVVVVEEKTWTQEVPYATREIRRNSLAPGQRQVHRVGRPGLERVRVYLTYENGQRVGRKEEHEGLRPPVEEEVFVGPPAHGTPSS